MHEGYMTDDGYDWADARALITNFSITLVAAGVPFPSLIILLVKTDLTLDDSIGIHLFMSLYGSAAYLETPKALRAGRTRYIFISFVITILSSITASFDMMKLFNTMFSATSPADFRVRLEATFFAWCNYTSIILLHLVILIGEVLLVSSCR